MLKESTFTKLQNKLQKSDQANDKLLVHHERDDVFYIKINDVPLNKLKFNGF